jgi:hypothetical protein
VRKIITLYFLLAANKSWAAASAGAASSGAFVSAVFGGNPIIWFWAGVGAIISHIKFSGKSTRKQSLANAALSVCLGGFLSEPAADWLVYWAHSNSTLTITYGCAFAIGSLWPILLFYFSREK